jgi:RNA polymerase sigma factor (sigma-70 family)
MTDSELAQRFIEGDAEAARTITGWISAVAHHTAWGQPDLAEDGASDATLRVLNQLREGRYRGLSSLKTYVSRVARYTMIDLLRHQRRTRDLVTDENVDRPPSSNPESELLKKEEAYLFGRILGLIDEKCRRLWERIFAERLSYREIAASEGVTNTTIKMRAYHCKESAIEIRRKLEGSIPDAN